MNLLFDKISTNQRIGTLYQVYYLNDKNEKEYITLSLNNVSTLFGLEKQYNNKYFKWVIPYDVKDTIELLESTLKSSFKEKSIDKVFSKIIKKYNYPMMLETKINNKSNSYDIISHTKGEILGFEDILNKTPYNIILQLKNISIKAKDKSTVLYYNLEITKINKCVNN